MREQPARVFANRPLGAAGEVFKRERASSAPRPHMPEAESNTAPAIGKPGPDLPGLQWYCLMKGQAVGSVSRHAWAPPQAQPGYGLSPGPRPLLRPIGSGGAGRCCLHPATDQGPGASGRGKGRVWGWMPTPSLAQKPQGSRERKRPTVSLGRLCPFTPGRFCWGCQGTA